MFTYWRRGVLWQGCGRQDKLRQTVLAFHHVSLRNRLISAGFPAHPSALGALSLTLIIF